MWLDVGRLVVGWVWGGGPFFCVGGVLIGWLVCMFYGLEVFVSVSLLGCSRTFLGY